jgi:hypothetical protein
MSVLGYNKEFHTRSGLQKHLDSCSACQLKQEIAALHMGGHIEIHKVDGKIIINEINPHVFVEHTTPTDHNDSGDLIMPTTPMSIREDAQLNVFNGVSLHNAAVMWYGRAKSGKTRTLIQAFQGEDFLFLDFDRNYKSTIQSIQESGATYLNGDAAFDALTQLASGRGIQRTVIIDALGSVISRITNWFIAQHTDPNKTIDDDGYRMHNLKSHIGVSHEATVTFFNLIIEPMTRNFNSINFVHHTTESFQGSKMEGNKGAWLSVFDFTYHLNTERKVFELEAGRLPIAPKIIGDSSPRQQLIQGIKSSIQSLKEKESGDLIEVAKWNDIYKSKQSLRPLMNTLKEDGTIVFAEVVGSRASFIDVKRTLDVLNPPDTTAILPDFLN